MADLASSSSGIRKLNSHNYGYWQTCMESYLQGQDLWEVVAGTEAFPPENADALRKWKIKSGKAMFVLKTTIEEDLLEHIRDEKTPKEAWETLAKLFSRKNEAWLQLLENELAGISQGNLSISQYFSKVKFICREISQLAPDEKVSETRMKRIIIHGLRPEYNGFMAAVMGWPTPPSVVELENLLINQEELAKKMGSITIKEEEEALFTKKKSPHQKQWKPKPKWTEGGKEHPKERSKSLGETNEKDKDQNGTRRMQEDQVMDASIVARQVTLLENADFQGGQMMDAPIVVRNVTLLENVDIQEGVMKRMWPPQKRKRRSL